MNIAKVLEECTVAEDFLNGLEEYTERKESLPEHMDEAKIYQLAAEVARDIQSHDDVLKGFNLNEEDFNNVRRTALYTTAYTEAKAAFAADPTARITAKTDAAVEHFLLPKVVMALQNPELPVAAITQLGKMLIELGTAKTKGKVEDAPAAGTNLKLLINVDLGNGDTRQIGIQQSDEKVIEHDDLD